jgi:hypothetical protein
MSDSTNHEPVARESKRPVQSPVASPVQSEAKEQARRPVASEARRCSHTTAAGRPCRAWAVHGTDPPACSAHAGRTRGAGGRRGNQNARKHGFYARTLSKDEIADLEADPDLNLAAEIACARIALRRVLQHLARDSGQLSAADQVRSLALIFHGTRTIARLLRDYHALGGDVSRLARTTDQVLDELAAKWGIDL